MYETDQEQIEAIKSWWSQNGNWVIGAFVVFIAAYVGLHFYQSAAQNHRFEGSAQYEQLLLNVTAETEDADARQALVGRLKADYADLGYATMAALLEAKIAVDAQDYEAALAELNWAADNADAALATVIAYRQAQVQYALGDLEAALASLNSITGTGHEALVFELKGDILLAQGQTDDARNAYQVATSKAEDQGLNNPYLQIKLDDLAVAE